MNEEVDNYTKVVLVQNLSHIVSEDDIRRFFSGCGNITKIRIIYDKMNRPKGTAFIAFENHDMAINALMKDEKRFLDRYVYVELNKSPYMEVEMTQGEDVLKFEPMLGKPYSENPLILEAYESLRKKKEEEELKRKRKEEENKIKEQEEKERIEKEEKLKSIKTDSEKRNRKKHRKHHHHRDKYHKHHHHHHIEYNSDEYELDNRKQFYSELPEIA